MHAKQIGIYGLRNEEINCVKKYLPQKECNIMVTDDATDIIAVSEFAVIVNADTMNPQDIDMLLEYYEDIIPFSETVIFLGTIQIPSKLKNQILVYENFESLKQDLKYILLSAYRTQKKTETFSATLANAILILSVIRRKPYVTSRELAEKLGLSLRSIQRYINTIQATGEWIEYDSIHKGWYLQDGKSILWGDLDEE